MRSASCAVLQGISASNVLAAEGELTAGAIVPHHPGGFGIANLVSHPATARPTRGYDAYATFPAPLNLWVRRSCVWHDAPERTQAARVSQKITRKNVWELPRQVAPST